MPVRYIRVKTDTSALRPVATRSYGNIAIVGPMAVATGTVTVTGTPPSQTLTLTPTTTFPPNSAFTISFGGQTTGSIPVTAAGADVQTALVALSSVGSGNVKVTGNAGGPYTIIFQGTL